jgi:hypothetical protein
LKCPKICDSILSQNIEYEQPPIFRNIPGKTSAEKLLFLADSHQETVFPAALPPGADNKSEMRQAFREQGGHLK